VPFASSTAKSSVGDVPGVPRGVGLELGIAVGFPLGGVDATAAVDGEGEPSEEVAVPDTRPQAAVSRRRIAAEMMAFMPATTLARRISYQPEASSLKTTSPNSTELGMTRAR
jgi:hypothetical protein